MRGGVAMDEEKPPRELLHELGNTLQEKVALQYLLGLAANQIEELAAEIPDGELKEKAIQAAARFRRSAEL
jgi:hypothetical protein